MRNDHLPQNKQEYARELWFKTNFGHVEPSLFLSVTEGNVFFAAIYLGSCIRISDVSEPNKAIIKDCICVCDFSGACRADCEERNDAQGT